MDERLNPEKSAKAAASLLKILHHDFGDWRLALAAYNAGDGRVHGLIGKQRPMSFDAIATRLPAETQLYVPKVEATVKRRTGRSLGELQIPRF
jgi:membrane-bound lytic murein transglycosylase D